MDEAEQRLVEVFEQQRPRLMGISYRILGSVSDAEDMVQEAWIPPPRPSLPTRCRWRCWWCQALGRTESAVRQLVHRAQEHVDEGRTRYQADRSHHGEVLQRFMATCQFADLDLLLEVLAPDVVIISDGGGVTKAPRRPVHGRDNVARLLMGILHNLPEGAVGILETFNGRTGIVVRVAGTPVSALAVRVGGDQVAALLLLANPDKLRPLGTDTGTHLI